MKVLEILDEKKLMPSASTHYASTYHSKFIPVESSDDLLPDSPKDINEVKDISEDGIVDLENKEVTENVMIEESGSNEIMLSQDPDEAEDFIDRLYQKDILEHCEKENRIVVLPTGAGKTLIAVRLLQNKIKHEKSRRLERGDRKIALFLAPKIPLVLQQSDYINGIMDDADHVACFYG